MKALILLILSFTTAYAQKQITGRVINERTKEAVPFATVTFLNTKNGANADVNGVFTLKGTEKGANDTLLFAAIGYTPVKRAVNDLIKSPEVRLQEDIKTLNEVNISDKRKELMIGNYNIGTHLYFRNTGAQLAKRFEMPATHQYLKEIWITRNLTYFPFPTETRFRVNIYSENPKTKGPGERICLDTIEVHDLNNREIRVDVSKYNISITSSPFFVGIETIPIPYNERYYIFRAGNAAVRDHPAYYEVLYQPFVSIGRKDNEGWALALRPGSKWMKRDFVPAIKIVVN
jgi:hypothetical protein